MSTPPRVTAEQMAEAISRIHERHLRIDDPYREELTYEPGQVLLYLRKRGPGQPDGVRADDHFDALMLHVWLWWQHQNREEWLLDTAYALQLRLADVGEVFGIGAQGVRDRRDRAHALLDEGGPGRPDEKVARADRAAGAGPVVGEVAWLAAARVDVLSLAGDVLEWYPRVSEDTGQEMVDLRRDVRSGAYGPATWRALVDAVWALSVEEQAAGAQEAAEPLLARLEVLDRARAAAVGRASALGSAA